MKKQPITPEEYSVQFTNDVLKQLFDSIDAETERLGADFGSCLTTTLLASFVGNIIYRGLVHSATETSTEEQKFKNYQHDKDLVSRSVAKGFEVAFRNFSNITMDYYCVVQPVPEPINKEMC